MKNYKLALFNEINGSTIEPREYLDGYAQDFITDHDAESSQYICDAISEFADSNTSIYYYDIMQYIKDNPDDVNDAINEFGWDGCGRDIYKAGQMAEYMSIERELYNNLEDIIKYITLDFIDNTDEADYDAERIWEDLDNTDEADYDAERIWEDLDNDTKNEFLDEFVNDLENIDNNSRFDEIIDLYNEFIEKIIINEKI